MAEAVSPEESETSPPVITDSYTLFSFVDEVESRVDLLRRQASSLTGERASLLMIMDQLKSDCMNCDISPEDCQELVTNMERLKARCEAVEIQVHTVRDEGQRQSLHKVNDTLKELQTRLISNHNVSVTALQQAHSYLNACLPEPVGPIDSRFQSLVLGCAVDDQKDIRRRLESLVREWSSRDKADSMPPENSKDSVSNTDLSNNSARVLNTESASSESPPVSSSLPSDVVTSGVEENMISNHLTLQWFATPRDLSSQDEKQPAQPKARERNEHPPRDESTACNEEEGLSQLDSCS